MNDHCVVFRGDHKVGGTYASNAAEPWDRSPVFDKGHKTGDLSVGGAVHHLIYNICLSQTIMVQSSLFIIYHDGNRTLILECFVNPFIGQLAAVHAFPGLLRHRFFFRFFFRLLFGCLAFRNICDNRCDFVFLSAASGQYDPGQYRR